jgi:hypothetical protein
MESSIDIVPMDSDTVSVDCSENNTGEVNPDVDYTNMEAYIIFYHLKHTQRKCDICIKISFFIYLY